MSENDMPSSTTPREGGAIFAGLVQAAALLGYRSPGASTALRGGTAGRLQTTYLAQELLLRVSSCAITASATGLVVHLSERGIVS